VKSSSDKGMYALKVISQVKDEDIMLLNTESQIHKTLKHKNIIKYNRSVWFKDEEMFII